MFPVRPQSVACVSSAYLVLANSCVFMSMPNDLIQKYQAQLVGKIISSNESATVSALFHVSNHINMKGISQVEVTSKTSHRLSGWISD